MSKDSDITPFSGNANSPSSASGSKSARMRRIGSALKWSGISGFWIQLILGVVSTVMLLLTIASEEERSNSGISFSIFCAVCGIICLIVGITISFRYSKMAVKFSRSNVTPPKKSATIKIAQVGLITGLVGIFLTIIGAEAITGIVLLKILVYDPSKVFNNQTNTEYVNSLDLFVAQANINITAAHFAGVLSSLWILNRIDK